MECVYLEASPPFELRLGWQCDRYHCLPDTGAYFDQDYVLLYRMSVTMNIYNTVQKWRASDSKTIHKLTDNDRRILRMLKDMGVMFN